MVMRVGGIASGMDIEAMVKKLMEAERMPLDRLKQQQTILEWKRDAFREINSTLLDLDNMMFDLKMSYTYKPKSATSSQESIIGVTANSNAPNGSYNIEVTQLAKNEMQVSGKINPEDVSSFEGTHTFYTYDEKGDRQEHKLTIEEGDSLPQVLKNIEKASGNTVRAFYDETSKQVVLETTRTGKYNENENGNEIEFGPSEGGNEFFTDFLGLSNNQLADNVRAKNATFSYNDGLTLTSRDNSYTLNGVTFDFKATGTSRVTVDTDVDAAFDNIIKFVDKYNEAIDKLNKSQSEERFRDFQPLSNEQKAEMSEKQIEQWEEKAKSGILRNESLLRDGMYALRQSLQSKVETGGEYTLLSQIGITTTEDYMDGGKLKVDEKKLKEALRENPDDVYKLFVNNAEGNERGLINRFDNAVDRVKGQIEKQAGREGNTLDNYSIGKRMKEMNERISDFERRMLQVEQRYWNQFTQMEKAISNLNQQSSYLFSQFGGGM
ncbi:flagellar hook-associated protein 2 [Pseudogracilibacillus sp. SE30717A]|uniref:flagellar hook-associated protein 2 n=1 Tax=Pseudogracilibacillus sp. SE30717A TaxID=3098293 RepID=UPI00300E0704